MKKLITLFTLCCASFGASYAQISFGGKPLMPTSEPELRAASAYQFSIPSNVEDLKAKATWKSKAIGVRIVGQAIPANLSFAANAHRVEVQHQTLYRLKIKSDGARSIGIGYKKFLIPKGGKLFITDAQGTYVLGAYTHETNPEGGAFMTDFVPGDEVVLQYESRAGELPEIVLDHIGYMFAGDFAAPERQADNSKPKISADEWGSGICQVNIGCSEGAGWQEPSKGIVQIYQKIGENYAQCSGTLLNNTQGDFKPYIITAAHCAMNHANTEIDESDYNFWLFRFNYRRPGCANDQSVKPYAFTMTGAERCCFLSIIDKSDGLLLKLKQDIPAYYGAYFNGWDRRDVNSSYRIEQMRGLHHPYGDVMKIASYKEAPKDATWKEFVAGTGERRGAENAHWGVYASQTENGHSVTEPGSSGSGLFNNDSHKLIGTLSGGVPQCEKHINARIYYGKLAAHWNRFKVASDPHSSMDRYLDPVGEGAAESCDGAFRKGDCLLASPTDFHLVKIEGGKAFLSWTNPPAFPQGASITLWINQLKKELPVTAQSFELSLSEVQADAIVLQLASTLGEISSQPTQISLYKQAAGLANFGDCKVAHHTGGGMKIAWEAPRQYQLIGATNFSGKLPYIANDFNYVDGKALNYNRLYFGLQWDGCLFRTLGKTYVVGVRAIAPKSPGLCDYAILLRNGVKTYQDKDGDYHLDSTAAPFYYKQKVAPVKGSSKAERLSWQTFFLSQPFEINPDYQMVGAWEMTSMNKFSTDVLAMDPSERKGSDSRNVFSFDGVRWLNSSQQTIAKGVQNRGMAFQLILSNNPTPIASLSDLRPAYSEAPLQWSQPRAVEVYRDGTLIATLGADAVSYVDKDGRTGQKYEVKVLFQDGSSVSERTSIRTSELIKVYPTEVITKVYIEGAENISEATLLDAQGQELQHLPRGEAQVDMSVYPQGVYLLKVLATDGNLRLIKLFKK